MDHLLRWGRDAFIVSTSVLLVLTRVENRAPELPLAVPLLVLVWASVVTLPFAIVSVWREADSVSRPYWIILLGVCLILMATVVLWR
jgi:hypothetical protein